MGRRVLAVVVAAALIAAAACSSFSSDDGGSAPGSDAGSDATSAVVTDAGSSTPFCSTVDAQFCWSFDEGVQPLIGPKLTATQLAPTLTAEAKSPPSAMQAALSGSGTTGVELDVADTVASLHCEGDVQLAALTSAAGAQVAVLVYDYDWSFGYYPVLKAEKKDDTTARMYLGFPGQTDQDLGNVPIGSWVHVYLEADALGGSYSAKAQVEANGEKTLAMSVDGGATTLPHFNHVRFGLSTYSQVTWSVRYDNLVCRWH